MFDMDAATRRTLARQERRRREASRGRLGRERFSDLAGHLARVIRLAFEAGDTGSLFGLEGPLRAGIRRDLCLMGWKWQDADFMARELLDEAFRRARAVRPTWNEGQPEWTIQPGVLIERTRCARCHKPLPELAFKFCTKTCADAHSKHLVALREAGEDKAVTMATRSI